MTASSPKAEMTLPRHAKDLLIFPPSLSRTPSAPVALARSLHHKTNNVLMIYLVYAKQFALTFQQGPPGGSY